MYLLVFVILKIRKKAEEMKIKCYLRYRRGTSEVRCICKRDNPACDRHSTCIREVVNLNIFKGLEECFHNSEKRR